MEINALSFSCVDRYRGINFSYTGDFAMTVHTVTQVNYTKLIRLLFKNAWDNRKAIQCLDLWFPDEEKRTRHQRDTAEKVFEISCYRDIENLHGKEKFIAEMQNDILYRDVRRTKKIYERIVKRRLIYNKFRNEFPDNYFLGG